MTTEPHHHAPDREVAIAARGGALLEAVERKRLITLGPAWWQERLIEWATQDPEFRVRLLRFVDVLPALRSSDAIASHVRQYFRQGSPGAVRLLCAACAPPCAYPHAPRPRDACLVMAQRGIPDPTLPESLGDNLGAHTFTQQQRRATLPRRCCAASTPVVAHQVRHITTRLACSVSRRTSSDTGRCTYESKGR